MLLSRIEIHGFKSFADRTEFELDRGVTCLVGPNGCGKSNVVDAVKWALGEQRPTALRGDSMGDVVFKGNGSRPAMGFAEVTLVFDNANGGLAIETSEVAISRRLFRSGESEYLINRQPCRLKDVRELLVDTGLGQNAYAVLEQGRIDAVLAANPAERRSVFEEAAGIQRFRLRKREAARKLERVDQNLLRVADLIDELEKRVRSLKIQAGRARSYIALSDRLTALKTMVFLSTAADMAERAAGLQDELDEARRRDGASEAALGAAARAVEEADAEALVIRDAIARDRNRRVEVRAEHDNCATRRAALEQREAESRQAAQERGRQAAELEAEAAARASEARRLAEDEARLRAELARAEALAAERRAALERARAAAAAREAFLARLDADIVDLAEEELRLSNALASLESRTRGLRGARERLVRREAELAGLLEAVRLEAARVEGSLARLGGEARERAESIAAARAELADRIERGAETARRLAAVQASAARKESRKETLDGVIEKMEGVDEGSRALVRAARGDGARLFGVRGLLAELLIVPRDRARAVDAALGHLAGAVVVEDRTGLARCLEFLRKGGSGPATFLVLDAAPPCAGASQGEFPGEALLDGVQAPEELLALSQAMLGAARLLEPDADLASHLGSGRFLVTRDGARLEACGAYSDRPSSRTLGFVERKAERDLLQREVEELRAEQGRLEEESARLRGEVEHWGAVVDEAERQKREVDAGIAESRSQGVRLDDRAAIYRRELAVSAREQIDLEAEAAAAARESRAAAGGAAASRAAREQAEAARRAGSRERDAGAAALDQLGAEEAAAAREAVRLAERARAAKSEAAVLGRALEEQAAAGRRLHDERLELERRAEEAGAAARGLDQDIERLLADEAAARERLAELARREEAAAEGAKRARSAAALAAGERETARAAVHQLELAERELELGWSALRERAREEVSLDVEQGLADFDAAQAPPAEEVGRELAEVRERISRIGNVNLDAIAELEEVEGRVAFLTREKSDLDASRKSLESTIAELDKVSRARFEETFEAVRGHFRTLFRRLFHGGKADVFLQEGQDVLEAGIEIIAGPPGKDPRSITLLSGGERTMTAVALLFALFKAKPAPVAILDEVDAALDEANIERFCTLLGDFIGSSQFVIVTHSKRTMSYADVIFGVTMEESGVSKRIGIRLEDYEERVA